MNFSFATSINPATGQHVEDFSGGLALEVARRWADSDREQFPQAEQQVCGPFVLIASEGAVYAVDEREAEDAGLS